MTYLRTFKLTGAKSERADTLRTRRGPDREVSGCIDSDTVSLISPSVMLRKRAYVSICLSAAGRPIISAIIVQSEGSRAHDSLTWSALSRSSRDIAPLPDEGPVGIVNGSELGVWAVWGQLGAVSSRSRANHCPRSVGAYPPKSLETAQRTSSIGPLRVHTHSGSRGRRRMFGCCRTMLNGGTLLIATSILVIHSGIYGHNPSLCTAVALRGFLF